jgi:hypothetical protein
LEKIQKTKNKRSWFNNTPKIVLSSTILFSLVSTLPCWYSFLEKKKTPTKIEIPLQQGNVTYHVTTNSPTLLSLSQNRHYNYTYSLCLYGLITTIHFALNNGWMYFMASKWVWHLNSKMRTLHLEWWLLCIVWTTITISKSKLFLKCLHKNWTCATKFVCILFSQSKDNIRVSSCI